MQSTQSLSRRFVLGGTGLLLALGLTGVPPAFAQDVLPAAGAQQIGALLREKATRTPAQMKLDSQIHYAAKMARGQAIAAGVVSLPSAVSALVFGKDGLVHVDLKANVNPDVLAAIVRLGGRVESSFVQYQAIRAWVPLTAAETLAARSDVLFIRRAELGAPSGGPDLNGVKAHAADLVQSSGFTGTGVKIGVLSDGVKSLVDEQAVGRLPSTVAVISGQAGFGNEGTAMLEIVYSMAPGAQLFFATATGGEAQMAANIEALRAAGCDIIVDDYTYFDEAAFQDGTVAQAVNSVTASGALYFSDAANSGNLDSGTSGTWEGDFVDSGTSIGLIPETGTIHRFGRASSNPIAAPSQLFVYSLQWSDPFGASCNDYDLFVLDASLTMVEASSTDRQSCNADPIESIVGFEFKAGDRIVVVNYQGQAAPRALRLDTERGRLSIATAGSTFGHNAGASTITVAAADVASASGGVFLGGSANPIETFSSDGPRKIFYDAGGNAITPGNVLFGTEGGKTLWKVDLTAADGVTTGVNGFSTFYGTSAAAPHAAAIAALVKSGNPLLSSSQIKATLTGSALPVTFRARTAGKGIVMADRAIAAAVTNVTIDSSIAGLTFTVANQGCAEGTYTTPAVLPMARTAHCTISFPTPQVTGPGARAIFSAWTDRGRANPRNITVTAAAATYTAVFQQQYLLTLGVSPANGGIIRAIPALGYYNANATVSIRSNPYKFFVFSGFTGDLTGTTNPQNLIVSAPKSVTANFLATP